MKTTILLTSSILLVAACGGSEGREPNVATASSASAAPSTATSASSVASAAPSASPEELQKQRELAELRADRERWQRAEAVETARWTPELHSAAKALVEKKFPNVKAALTAIVASKHRKPANAARDGARHPIETLDKLGFSTDMAVLDIGPGEGWYTELLAPALASKGKYFATSGDPNGPADARPTFYAQRWPAFLAKSPELYGKVQTVVVDGRHPKLALDGQLDMVLWMRGIHGAVNGGTFDAWLAEIYRSLKPGGVLGVEEHRAAVGADAVQSAKKGYVPEAFVIEHAKAAGFEVGGQYEVNANPRDTKDYPEGVWALPPTFERGDKDREALAAIGESDRMTIKLVKPKAKK
jgi:predicted methyltransferase